MPLKPIPLPTTRTWVGGVKRYFLLVTATLIAAGSMAGGGPAHAQQPPPTTPQLSINDVLTVTPGRSSVTTPMTFAVTLIPPSTETVAVFYATVEASAADVAPFAPAAAGVDFVPSTGILAFAPGETVKIIRVPIINHDIPKPNRAFVTLLVNATNAPIAKPVGVGKITNQRVPYQAVECPSEIPGLTGNPIGFVLGKDGNFWMTDAFQTKLLVFDPRTQVGADVPLPPDILPHFITNGPDGNLWFTALTDRIVTVDPATRAISFIGQGITPKSVPHVIVSGPDGNLYFTEEASELIPDPLGRGRIPGNGRLAQLNPNTRNVTEFPVGLPAGNRAHGLDVGPDGNLWLTLGGTDQLARFNLATKQYDKFVKFSAGSNPQNVLAGPDGNLYVTLEDINKLGRYNPRTGEVREFATSLTREDGPSLLFFTVGPDRNSIWFTEFLNDRIGVFDIRTEQITEIDCGLTPGGGPIGIAIGPDNAIWVSEVVLDPRFPGRLARVVPGAAHRFTDANVGFVTSLYRDVLGREPQPSEVASSSSLIQRGSAGRTQVAQALLNSQEARAQAIQRTYATFLGRQASLQEVATATGLMDQGGIRQVEVSVLSSDEYFQRRGGGISDGFLAALYSDLLARISSAGDQLGYSAPKVQPSPFGYIGIVNPPQASQPPSAAISLDQVAHQLDAGAPRRPVVEAVILSQEHAEKLVRSFFGGYLVRPAKTSDLTPLVTKLVQGAPSEVVLATILGSDEYRDRRVLARP